jgi:hypothetical protein
MSVRIWPRVPCRRLAEWTIASVLKTDRCKQPQGFESLTFCQMEVAISKELSRFAKPNVPKGIGVGNQHFRQIIGDRLTVGHNPLTVVILVRNQISEPWYTIYGAEIASILYIENKLQVGENLTSITNAKIVSYVKQLFSLTPAYALV